MYLIEYHLPYHPELLADLDSRMQAKYTVDGWQ